MRLEVQFGVWLSRWLLTVDLTRFRAVSSDLTFIKKSILLRSSLVFKGWLRCMGVSVMLGKSLGLGGCNCGGLLYGL